MHNDLSHYIYQFSYLGIFLWFVVIEQVTPVPEEVSLMTVGYISVHSSLNPFICWSVSLGGLLIADNLLFYLSHTGNKITKKWLRKVNSRWIHKIKEDLKA